MGRPGVWEGDLVGSGMTADATRGVNPAMRLLIYAPGAPGATGATGTTGRPRGRDAKLTEEVLGRAGVSCRICQSFAELCAAFEDNGAGAILLFEEAIADRHFDHLAETLERQPPWSDIAVLLVAGSAGREAPLDVVRSIDTLRNVTLLERPMRVATVLSTVRAALRSRHRQYEVRDLLVALHRAHAEAESANRLKDEFLATLSHELRTPLNAILGWTSMLRDGQVEASRMPRVFVTLERNAQAQAQLISDVLDVSRIITGKLHLQPALVDICEVVERALDTLRPAALAKDISVRLDIAEHCNVRGDADRLQQVFWNLLSNAVKFTPAGGAIAVNAHRRGAHLEVEVADTGAGIDAAFLPFVFDRFRQADQSTTRRHGGLGLGLALVKHLVELHGGTVDVTSGGPGTGATFRVRLPAATGASTSSSGVADPDGRVFALSLLHRTILVVDDDLSTREVVTAVLSGAGAQVLAAGSPADALRALAARSPDAIVADLGMPDEDGFSFIAGIRRSDSPSRQVPALALSAYVDSASQQRAIDAGFTAFLAKPARPQDLLQAVHRLLDRPATR